MYGPGKEAVRGFVITNTIDRILKAQQEGVNEIEMWGTGKPTRDFLFVKDAAEGIVLAAEKYDKPEPVNLGSGWEISIKELAATIARLMDFKGKIIWNTEKPDGQMRRMMDGTRAQHEFGFQPKTSFEDGLRETIEWRRQNLQT
jgi:GDP-L-fucose synthase